MGLFDRLFGKKKQEEQVVNEEQLAADQQELNTDEPVSTVIEEKKHADQKVDQKEEPVVPKEGLSSAQPKDSEQVLPRPTAEPTLINPSEETSENEEVSAEPVVTEPQIKPTSDEPVSPAAEPEPVAEEEDIVIDIDALADIFTQSREETEKKYEQSLSLTRKTFADGFNELFANFRTVDEEFFEELEETLIMSDVGVDLAMEITEELRKEAKLVNAKSTDDLRQLIIEKIVDKFDGEKLPSRLDIQPEGLTVLLFVGVNGVGKTTTIGKLAARYKNEGKRVLLAAADTFRAGAIDQLVEWGNRSAVEVVTKPAGSDPAAVVFDALAKAKAENYDILLVDTAGRLQNKDNLMKELEKIGKVIKREIPDAPHETILALDATTGQNAIQQAKEFSAVTPISGIALTKLDGSAKGGIVLSIVQSLKIPVKLIGLGEKLNDLQDFDEEFFVRGLFKELL
ncbi:signal recognition particle-docking protein FtsY [Lactococcus taiwanensis]|uniref:signal recognition particle-docking protein FtsY n=1 Tax=Lactococcus taiwanensis TaxID=1151742 RepID=UPI0019654F70|nr:signal recognition particle-docking protein FtsY [Lactococcus taiwanensis]QRZ11951.1 signal recognition particle-docking protein FtsY [Lactococcus taiwanensis]